MAFFIHGAADGKRIHGTEVSPLFAAGATWNDRMECKMYSAPGCRTFPTRPVSFTQAALADVLSLYSYELCGQTARHANGSRKKRSLCLYMAKRGFSPEEKAQSWRLSRAVVKKWIKAPSVWRLFPSLSRIHTSRLASPHRIGAPPSSRMTGFTEDLSRESRRRVRPQGRRA